MTGSGNGKTVFVAGGAKGIGRGIVTSLAADGYDVSFSYLGSADAAAQLSQELQGRYPSQAINSHKVDLGDRDQVDEFAENLAIECKK